MIGFRNFMAICASVVVIAGCTSSGGDQINSTLAAPQAATQTATSQQASATALAQSDQASAAENVTNAQLSEPQQQAALDPSASVTFLPVQGAPQDKVTILSRSLRESAQTNRLSLVPTNQSGSQYQVKGYFSALSDGSGTLLVYIWDVLDGSGKRLHRINGQERASSIKSDPWQAITDVELNRVANTTTSRLKSWIDSQSNRG